MVHGFLIFHLNLAFSSIPSESRLEVIHKCYWPLLELIDKTKIPIGIELTGWTLQQIAVLDRDWVEHFRNVLAGQQCELIGSGWSQIIGPLVPYDVNRWNQELGLNAYQHMLSNTPRLALVNEMAFSTGMVNLYAGKGYKGIIMDRDNVRLALGLDHIPLSAAPTAAFGCGDLSLPVLWSDSILFQRLQRVIHGDISISEYMAYLQKRKKNDETVLPIYCNDAEIFDYRPGRFTSESRLHPEGEWNRLQQVLDRLEQDLALTWVSPSKALDIQQSLPHQGTAFLTSASHPIPVKKQAKYNINRWAVTGRDDLWLNTICHQIFHSLNQSGSNATQGDWQTLCELWASDLRTHITDQRWNETLTRISTLAKQFNIQQPLPDNRTRTASIPQNTPIKLTGIRIDQDEEGITWTFKTKNIHLELNMRRGLAIKSLAFKSHNFEPIVGTLPQGYFSSIELGADFYSGGVLVEIPGTRVRATDLEWVIPSLKIQGTELIISTTIPLAQGTLEKTISLDTETEQISLTYNFVHLQRPLGIVRVGIITILSKFLSFPLSLHCKNGGKEAERFVLDRIVDHGRAASTLVSSTASLGATDGHLEIEDRSNRRLVLSWNPAACAAAPQIKHQQEQNRYLTRISFSLCELDDTSRNGGRLLPFFVRLSTK